MGKITFYKDRSKCVISNRLIGTETINERIMNAIACGVLSRFLPVTLEKKKKEQCLQCVISGMVPLKEHLTFGVTRELFFSVIDQMISIMRECESNHIDSDNIEYHLNSIFIEPSTWQISCIYWPIVNNQSEYLAVDFFRDLPNVISFNKREDIRFISDYNNYMKLLTPFSLHAFEKCMKNFHPINQNSEKVGVERKIQKNHAKRQSIAYNPFHESSCEPLSDESFHLSERKEMSIDTANDWQIEGASGTTVLGEEFTGTTRLDESSVSNGPYLLRERTRERIEIDKPFFRIGKERRCCDYSVSDNNAVSRSHADIITRENRYYIVDNNSTNYTYVDKRVIPVKQEIEIFSGTQLRLANEEFTFYL